MMMLLGDGAQIAMIRDGLSRLLEARSLFACVEVLATNLVLDPEGDRRLLGDQQMLVSDLVCEDDERSVRAILAPCNCKTSPRTSVLGRGSDRQSAGSVDRKM